MLDARVLAATLERRQALRSRAHPAADDPAEPDAGKERILQTLQPRHPSSGDAVESALTALYSWNYDSEIDELRTLYANALERQWIALRDLDWQSGIDEDAFSRTFSVGGFPIQKTRFWQGLPASTRWEVSRRTAAFLLSNFLHGEQGALMVAAQLVAAVPHMDGKFYASTQTLDEARHVEVFAAYIRMLDDVHPVAPSLKQLLDGILRAETWLEKAVGMNVVTEGLALYSFRDMRNQTEEPLLKKLLTYVSRDEARHTGYGIKYLSAVIPTLSEAERHRLEDFAFESARLLVDSRAGVSMRQSVFEVWGQAGLDPATAFAELAKEREAIAAEFQKTGGRLGPVRGFVIPTLKAIGLGSERLIGHFDEMFQANFGARTASVADDPWAVPDDLEAWVEEGA